MAVTDQSVYLDLQNSKIDDLFNTGKVGHAHHRPVGAVGLPRRRLRRAGACPATTGTNHETIAGPDMWVLFDNGEERADAAWEFVKWFTAAEQVQKRLDGDRPPAHPAVGARHAGVHRGRSARSSPATTCSPRTWPTCRRRGPCSPATTRSPRPWARRSSSVLLGESEPQAGAGRGRRDGERDPGGRRRSRRGATEARRMGRFRRFLGSDHVAGWAFILPSVALILLFGLFPIVWGFVLSLQKASLLNPVRPFIGLAQLRGDPEGPADAQGGAEHADLHDDVRADLDRARAVRGQSRSTGRSG